MAFDPEKKFHSNNEEHFDFSRLGENTFMTSTNTPDFDCFFKLFALVGLFDFFPFPNFDNGTRLVVPRMER